MSDIKPQDRQTLARARHAATLEYMTALFDGSYAELCGDAHWVGGERWTHWPSFPKGFQLVRECRRLNLLPPRQVHIPELLRISAEVLGIEDDAEVTS